MRISLRVAAALLPLVLAGLPGIAHAQPYPQRFGPPSVPPSFGGPQIGQVPLLGTLDIGGLVQSGDRAMPRGCIYGGQLYSEGAMVRSAAGRQVCVQQVDAVPDAAGQVPLVWGSLAND